MRGAGVKSIAKNGAYLAIAKALTSVARIIYAVFLAKLLGPELYGMFQYGFSWYLMFLPISMLGLNAIMVREIGRHQKAALPLLRRIAALRGASSLLAAALCIGLGLLSEHDQTARSLLFIFSVALIGRGLAAWTQGVFKAFEKSILVLQLEATFRIAEVIAGLAALLAGGGVLEVAAVHAGVWVCQAIVGFRMVRRSIVVVEPVWDTSAFLDLVKQGLPFVVATFLAAWLVQGGILLFRWTEGYTHELGEYALAVQAFSIIAGIIAESASAAVPVLSRSAHRRDGKGKVFVDLVLRSGFLFGAAATIAGITLGDAVLGLVFSDAYANVAALLPWALMSVGPYFFVSSLSGVLTAEGKFYSVAISYAIGAALFTVLVVILYRQYGPAGMFWATACGLIATNALQLFFLRKHTPIKFVASYLAPLVAAVSSIAICYWSIEHLGTLASLGTSIGVLIGTSLILNVIRWNEVKSAFELLRPHKRQ